MQGGNRKYKKKIPFRASCKKLELTCRCSPFILFRPAHRFSRPFWAQILDRDSPGSVDEGRCGVEAEDFDCNVPKGGRGQESKEWQQSAGGEGTGKWRIEEKEPGKGLGDDGDVVEIHRRSSTHDSGAGINGGVKLEGSEWRKVDG